jgi:hypothetical protein
VRQRIPYTIAIDIVDSVRPAVVRRRAVTLVVIREQSDWRLEARHLSVPMSRILGLPQDTKYVRMHGYCSRAPFGGKPLME